MNIFWEWQRKWKHEIRRGHKVSSRTSLSLSEITSIVALLSHLPLFQEYSQNVIQQRKFTGRKLSQEMLKKALSAFLRRLMWFGSYHQKAIQQFCFPGCRITENCYEWVSGPAKESLVPCQLQCLGLPQKHTACPTLLIRPPHPASNSHVWQKRTIQVLI